MTHRDQLLAAHATSERIQITGSKPVPVIQQPPSLADLGILEQALARLFDEERCS
ncbi:MAG: hypothetical protein AB7O24_23470 [Kofleriaceae bacterium]